MRGLRSSFVSLLIVSLALAAGGALLAQRGQGGGRGQQANRVEIQEGQECPPGMTEVRHLQCQAPAEAAPSIVDYRPRSTVVAPEHLVPKAKYPVVDVHTHVTETPENMPKMIQEMGSGQTLRLEFVDSNLLTLTTSLPLGQFASVHKGAPAQTFEQDIDE